MCDHCNIALVQTQSGGVTYTTAVARVWHSMDAGKTHCRRRFAGLVACCTIAAVVALPLATRWAQRAGGGWVVRQTATAQHVLSSYSSGSGSRGHCLDEGSVVLQITGCIDQFDKYVSGLLQTVHAIEDAGREYRIYAVLEICKSLHGASSSHRSPYSAEARATILSSAIDFRDKFKEHVDLFEIWKSSPLMTRGGSSREFAAVHAKWPYEQNIQPDAIKQPRSLVSMAFKLARVSAQLDLDQPCEHDIFVRLRPDIISTSGIAWETLRSPQNGTFVVPAQGAYGHQTNLHGERSPHAGVTDNFALLSARAMRRYNSLYYNIPALHDAGVIYHAETMTLMNMQMGGFKATRSGDIAFVLPRS